MKLTTKQYNILRKELGQFYFETAMDTYVARQAIRNMISKGETKVTTIIPFINQLVDEMISSVTIADIEKNGQYTKLNLFTIRQATKTFLLSFAIRCCAKS